MKCAFQSPRAATEKPEAVIIAAGFGSRLASLAPSKPLIEVCGQPLIAIVARQLAAAGVTRAVVVTGHRASEVESALPAIAERCSIAIEPVRVKDWSVPNGHSVIAGAAAVDGDFLLVMADHIFSAGILAELMRRHNTGHAVTLAVDRRIASPTLDPDDATFVRLAEDGMIRAIGKHLSQPDAVDCGAFFATPALADAIGRSIAEGRPGSLSDGMQWLADRGLAGTMDIGGSWWIDVDEVETYHLAQRELLGRLPHLRTEQAMRSRSAPLAHATAPAQLASGR